MPFENQFPLVTFLSPCYNHERYVLQSLESIRSQTYSNIHHIIIDDASSDNSVSLIEQWIKKNNYQCTFIKHKTNKGISATLNESIKLIKGEFWTCISTDDYVSPLRTELFVEYLQKHPEVGMVVSDMLMVDDFNDPVSVNNTTSFLKSCLASNQFLDFLNFGNYDSLIFGNYIPGSLMIRKSVFDELGGFNENLKIEDWDMWLRISTKYKIGFINEFLGYYRRHPDNTVNAKTVVNKDLVRILLSQKNYCYKSGQEKLFRMAYRHHFNYLVSPRNKIIKLFFKEGNLGLFIDALFYKIRKKLVGSINS